MSTPADSRRESQPTQSAAGPDLEAPSTPRSPWQRFYGAAHAQRRRYWASRSERLPRPTLSIGNLGWGGGGKTPLTAAVAAHLRDSGHRVAVLSRGYRSRGDGVRLVSRGEGAELDPAEAGDEPVLLADQLPGVAVVVHPRRLQAGRAALELLDPAPDLFLLDDGFSHLRLARDLDLLAFPSADPFAGGRLPPSGRLREPLASCRHADAVLLTGSADLAAGAQLAEALRPHGFAGPGFASRSQLGPATRLDGAAVRPGLRILAVSGIARPLSFEQSLVSEGFELAGTLQFADHHDYPAASLEKIRRTFARSGAEVVMVTSKDRVKLAGRLDLPLAELPLRAEPEAAFFDWLDRRLAAIGPRPGASP